MRAKKFIKKKLIRFRKWIKSGSWKKRALLLALVFMVLFFLLKSTLLRGGPEYSFDTVEKGNVTQVITVNGNVIASNATDVFSPTNGVLDEIFVKNGDIVAKGNALFTVRSTATPQEQASSFASYQSALNTLNTAQNTKLALDAAMWAKQQTYLAAQNEQNYKNSNSQNPTTGRAYTNLEKQSIDSGVYQTQKDFAAAEQAYKTADVAIADGQAQVAAKLLAYQATQSTTIYAPIAGRVHNLIGLKGARVEGQTSNAAQVKSAAIIASDTSEYTVGIAASEVHISKIKLEQPVTILFNGIANKKYKGRVTQIDTFGTNTNGIVTYNVFMAIEDGDPSIRAGMSAVLTISTDEHKDVLTVGNAAIITYEGEKVVQVLNEDGEIEFIPVSVGLRGNRRSEIVGGVDEETEVILGNTESMNQGGSSFTLGE